MRFKRRSRRTRGRRLVRLAVLLTVTSVVVIGVNPAAMVTKGDMTRDATVPVVDDMDATLSLDVVDSVKQKGGYKLLLTVTNNFAQRITVTVSLQNESDGVLRDNDERGVNSVTFDLSVGGSQQVDIDPDDSLSNGYEIYFDVTASASGLNVDAHDRSTTAQTGGGPPGGGGGPPGGGPAGN